MNLWVKMKLAFKYTGLIFGLALLLFACEDPGTIGLDVDRNNLKFKVSYKKFILPATIIQTDSIPTSNTGRVLTGLYNDPKFGLIQPTGFAEVWWSSNPNIDSAAVYDSLVLQLKLDYVYGEELEAAQTLKVHRLQETLDGIATYYNFTSFDYSEEPIGEVTFEYDFDEDNEIVDLDTVLRIHLSDDLGNEIFGRMLDETDTTFETLDNWVNFFSGVVLIPGDDYQTITGFNTRDSDSQMTLYYHQTNDDGEDENFTYDFPMENGIHSSHISYDRTGTEISTITDSYKEYTANDNFIYVQSGTGLVAKIDFSPYIEFTDSIENLIVNRGDLTLGEIEQHSKYLAPPSKIVYYLADSFNRRALTEDGFLKSIQLDNPTVDPTGVRFPIESEFVEDDQLYTDPMSGFLQALYDGTIKESSALTYPINTSNSKTFDRFLLDPQNIILEVYYSTSDQGIDIN